MLLIYSVTCLIIYNNYKQPISKDISTTINEKSTTPLKYKNTVKSIIENITEKPIGNLIINKIKLNENIYEITSTKNNVDKHVTILKHSEDPSIKNSITFLAAHSGTGKTAYFEKLDKLITNDLIYLEYKNKNYTYKVKNIWIDRKTGTITVPKENTNQLILTTCHPTKDDYQLIINCILI